MKLVFQLNCISEKYIVPQKLQGWNHFLFDHLYGSKFTEWHQQSYDTSRYGTSFIKDHAAANHVTIFCFYLCWTEIAFYTDFMMKL